MAELYFSVYFLIYIEPLNAAVISTPHAITPRVEKVFRRKKDIGRDIEIIVISGMIVTVNVSAYIKTLLQDSSHEVLTT